MYFVSAKITATERYEHCISKLMASTRNFCLWQVLLTSSCKYNCLFPGTAPPIYYWRLEPSIIQGILVNVLLIFKGCECSSYWHWKLSAQALRETFQWNIFLTWYRFHILQLWTMTFFFVMEKWLSTVFICKKLVQIVYIIFYDKYFYFKNHLSKPNVIGGV